MKELTRFSNKCKWAKVLLAAGIVLFLPHAARAQSSGPNVDVCSSEEVDYNNQVELDVCLSGDASDLSAETDVWAGDPNGTIANLDAIQNLYQGSTLIYTSTPDPPHGEVSNGGYDEHDVVPQVNTEYTLKGESDVCYDSGGNDDQKYCQWGRDMTILTVEAEVTGPTPTITNLSPTSGAVGTSVTITGTNFGSTQGTSTVTFQNTTATSITSWSATSIVAVVPSDATTGNVVVTVSGATSNGVLFTVPGTTPTVASVTPSSGSVGLAVTISGSGFGAAEGQTIVTVNGVAAGALSWSNSSIVAVVPSGATSGPVVVTLGDGEPSNNNVNFTVSTSPCN